MSVANERMRHVGGPSGSARSRAASVLKRSTGKLATAATARMDAEMPWFRDLSAEERSWVGTIVQGRITGVQPFGFFATVEELGGDGLVPAAKLGDEYFRYDEAGQRLVGEDSGEVYEIGQRLALRLAEADPASGSLRFELPDRPAGRARPARPQRRDRAGHMVGRRGRPANIRHRGRK